MLLVRSIDSSRLPESGCVLTIGNFDGVHRGHQKILAHISRMGRELDLPTVVMTFMPGPEEFFQGDRAAPRITTTSSRFFAVQEKNIDFMLTLPFNRKLSMTSAEDFIETFLVRRLKARYVLVGDDFRFGRGRKGDFQVMQSAGNEFGFQVERFNTIRDDSTRISSTRVRDLLAAGMLEDASDLLGRPFTMTGRVSHGDKRGRTWGFPTLNIPIHHKLPTTGVFAVQVTGTGLTEKVNGVANLGNRPTIGGMKTLLEVHLFDFDAEIYGRRICVEFIRKIRDEQKFDSFDELKQQILRDCSIARDIFTG